MKSMNKKGIILLVFTSVLLSGCSETTKQMITDGTYTQEIIKEKIDDAINDTNANSNESEKPQFIEVKMGDTFRIKEHSYEADESKDWLECVVSDAVIYEKPSAAGISENDMIGADYYAGGDDLIFVEPQLASEMKMLVCTLDLKLLNGSDVVNITEFELAYKAPDESLQMVAYPGYLSAANSDDYWEFNVEANGTEIKVGWTIVDSLAENGEFYFCRDLNGSSEDRCLIPLTVRGE